MKASHSIGEQKYPFRINGEKVKKEWLDRNGHMNVAWYIASASDASFELMRQLGLDNNYREQKQESFFTLETQIRYLQEIQPETQLSFEARILDANGKLFHTLWLHYAQSTNANKTPVVYLAAISEWIYAYVNLNTRKVTEYPEKIKEKIDASITASANLPYIERQGEPLGLKKTTHK